MPFACHQSPPNVKQAKNPQNAKNQVAKSGLTSLGRFQKKAQFFTRVESSAPLASLAG